MAGNYHWKIDFYEHGDGPNKAARVFSIPVSCSDGPGRFFGFVATGSVSTTRALLDLADDLAGKGEVRLTAAQWFEKLLAAANRRYAAAVANGDVVDSDKIVALWALQIRNGVHFSTHGAAQAYLHHKEGRTTRFTDVGPEGEQTGTALFGEVLSGALGGSDKMFFAGKELLNYVALHHLQFLLDKKPEPLEAMRQELTDVDAKMPIVAAMMRSVVIDRAIRVAEGEDASIEQLAQKTQASDGWVPPIPAAVKSVFDKVVETAQRAVSYEPAPPAKDGLFDSATAPAAAQPTPHDRTTDVPHKSAPPPGQGTITRLFKNIPETMGGLPEKLKAFATNMPGRARWILIGAAVLVIILIGSIVTRVILQGQTKAKAAYTGQLEDIQKRRNEIEASLIYNDEDRAWRALDAARELLAALPQKTKAQKKTVEELGTQLVGDAERLQRIARITPEVVSSLSEVSLPAPVSMALRGTEVLVADKGGIIAGFPTSGGAARVISVVPNRTYTAGAVDGTTFYVTNGNELYTLNGDTLTTSNSEALLDVAPRDMAFWNSRMYLAAPDKNQVVRLSKEGSGWGARTSWVTTPDPGLGDVTAIAIDGGVWTAGSAGKVQQFQAGTRANVSLRRIEPPLTALTDLFVSPSGDKLYLFDAAGKRVLLLKKDGTLLSQYVADWKDPKTFAVDEKNKFVYVLDGTTLTKFALP